MSSDVIGIGNIGDAETGTIFEEFSLGRHRSG